jgi:hypothetical protein
MSPRHEDGGAPARAERPPTKGVYALKEHEGKTYWTRIGVAFVNRDLSITVKLDCVPLSGTIQIREEDRSDDSRGR